MVHLSVTPEVSVADSPVKIYASGLAPAQLVTLHASLTDERGVKFAARAFYQANQNGEVDVAEASALGGNYTGVWSMGLFYTLKAEKMFHRLLKRDVTGSPFYVQISLFNSTVITPLPTDEPLATCTVERWYTAPGVERIPIKSGRVRGALFLPPGPGPFPGLIDLFGGAGGLIEFRAGLLASKGFAVLALAYFAYDDLPQTLEVIDLEYFEEATRLLLKNPKVRGPGLGIIGLSKGGEIALAMSTFLKEVVASVCIKMSGTPLHFHDVSIPGASYPYEKILINEMGLIYVFDCLRHPLDETFEGSTIPVEKAQGHILFVVRGPRAGVIGLSKGAEIALAMGTFLEEIAAAVCINGATSMNGAPLHFRDINIPAVPYLAETILINEIGLMSSFNVMGDPLDSVHEVSAIPVEKAQGHILFVVGEADQGLNSKMFAEVALGHAKKCGRTNCRLLSYPKAGHMIEPPGSPICFVSTIRGTTIPSIWGGEMKSHAKAEEHFWTEVLNFFQLHLSPAGNL
ncbi:LOW QUALITY PROTEIN: acyl-coenzyme A amino acid N-acyltransferase 1-like [Vipera latastei]